MKNLYSDIRNIKLPLKNKIKLVFSNFSKVEWRIFLCLVLIFFISTIGILESINKSFMVAVPMKGGSMREGIIGAPRFVNPILALSNADQDLVTLVYSGLMRKNEDGVMVPDLAESVNISKDGLVYTFTLKNKIYFHDGTPITVDDVIYTVNGIKDPIMKSPHKANWDGVSIEKINDRVVKFNLRQPYASFLENATLGIMPAHIWNNNSPIELNSANTNPIGSGPYQIKTVNKQASGIINYYELTAYKKFTLGEPYIKNITLRFYPNENSVITALENNEIDQVSSITPINAQILKEGGYRIESSVLPRVFGLFFNQNQNQIFTNKNIVRAINEAIDKEQIVHEILGGYGVVIEDPIPQNIIPYQKLTMSENISHDEKLAKAKEILNKDGWKIGSDGYLEKTTTVKKKKTTTKLEFSISTGNAPELTHSAELIKKDLESIGMRIEIKTFEAGNLSQSVIRPRKYDTLLFGQIVNRETDLYAFWHSSQIKDPGLNVAMYANSKVDKILADAYITLDEQQQIKKYAQFEDEIKKDLPAIFLYSPNFVYIVSKNLNRASLDHIITPADRFLNVYLWYTKIDNVWKIFSPNKMGS